MKNNKVNSEAVENNNDAVRDAVNPNMFGDIDVASYKNAGELTKALKKATMMSLPLKLSAMKRFGALEAERKEAAREAKLLAELTGVYRSAATTFEQRLMAEFRVNANALANAAFTQSCKDSQLAAFIAQGGEVKEFVYDAVQRDAEGKPVYKLTAAGTPAAKAESVIRLLSLSERRNSLLTRMEQKRRDSERDALFLEIAYLENEKKMQAEFAAEGNSYGIVPLAQELAERAKAEVFASVNEAHEQVIRKLEFAVAFALDGEVKAADFGITPETAIKDVENETAF